MKVLVLLAGISDPKWPLVRDGSGTVMAQDEKRIILSPFDESALEIGLKLREGPADVELTVAGHGAAGRADLLRSVHAYHPDRVLALAGAESTAPEALCDQRGVALRLALAVSAAGPPPDIILLGREFGDTDNGMVPACLAARLGWPLFGQAQAVRWEGNKPQFLREDGGNEEWFTASGPVVVSLSNDRRNRLRHPLMKNVMMAKRVTLEPPLQIPAGAPAAGGALRLRQVSEARAASSSTACRVLEGATAEQAAELAAFLRPWMSAHGEIQ